MSDVDRTTRQRARHGRMRASLISVACLLRGFPLFFSAAPRTPLRVLCIIALDTLHVLRHSRWLPRQRIIELATLLDFQAGTNAVLDHKDLCEAVHQANLERLEKAGLGLWVDEYVGRLQELERRRPPIGGDRRRFAEVRAYREAVARLSLATVTGIALNAERLEQGIGATQDDGDVETLFRIVMQCQIIDDLVDYNEDLAAGLPSFLTASASLPQGIEWTAEVARSYAASRGRSGDGAYPLRMALRVITGVTKLVVRAHNGRRVVEAARAGVDPSHTLIDRQRNDNVVDVK